MLEAAILGDSLGFGLKLRVRLFRDQSLHLFSRPVPCPYARPASNRLTTFATR
jgi:hypothetical protein